LEVWDFLQLLRAFSLYPYLRIKSELQARTSAMGLFSFLFVQITLLHTLLARVIYF
jgi:hypothetical protein